MAAALLIRHSVNYFPQKTVHVAVVDPGVGGARRPLLIEAAGNYFVGPDNGVLSLAFDEDPLHIIHLTNTAYHRQPLSKTFHGRDIFAPVAAHLSLGADPASCGDPIDDDFVRIGWPAVTLSEQGLEGEIVYIDGFGNLCTNIGAPDLQMFQRNKLVFNVGGIVVQRLATHYAARGAGGWVALINSWGLVEIALYQGSAEESCHARVGTK